MPPLSPKLQRQNNVPESNVKASIDLSYYIQTRREIKKSQGKTSVAAAVAAHYVCPRRAVTRS